MSSNEIENPSADCSYRAVVGVDMGAFGRSAKYAYRDKRITRGTALHRCAWIVSADRVRVSLDFNDQIRLREASMRVDAHDVSGTASHTRGERLQSFWNFHNPR